MPRKKNKAKQNISKNNVLRFVIPNFISAVIFLICICAFSFFLKENPIDEKMYKFISLSLLSISALSGGFVCGFNFKKNGILTGLLSSPLLLVVSVFSALVLSNGKTTYTLFISLILILLFSILGGISGVNVKFRRR